MRRLFEHTARRAAPELEIQAPRLAPSEAGQRTGFRGCNLDSPGETRTVSMGASTLRRASSSAMSSMNCSTNALRASLSTHSLCVVDTRHSSGLLRGAYNAHCRSCAAQLAAQDAPLLNLVAELKRRRDLVPLRRLLRQADTCGQQLCEANHTQRT